MAIINLEWVPKRQERALREQRESDKRAAEHKNAQCGAANLSPDTTTTSIPSMSTPPPNAWATGRLQQQIQASAPQKTQPSKGQDMDRAQSGVSGPASKASAPQKAQASKGQDQDRAVSGVSGPPSKKENVAPTTEAKGKWPRWSNATRDGTKKLSTAEAKDHSSGVRVSEDGSADSKDQSSSGPASPKSHSSDDTIRGFPATEKFPDFHQPSQEPLLDTIKPAAPAKFNAYLARGGKEDEAYAGKKIEAEDTAFAGKWYGPQRAPKTEQKVLPTFILVQFFYGQNYADKAHSAMISIIIPHGPPGPRSSYKPITCTQLIEVIESKANFPGPRDRLAKKLRTVHVVWQTPSEHPNYISPTPIVETHPRDGAGQVGTVDMSHQQRSDPRHYYYGGTPIPDYPVDEQGRPQMGPGLTQRGGVGYYDDHGNYKVTPYEQQPQMYPANSYHGETTGPSKWEKQDWQKSNAPTGKWADLSMLDDTELWNLLTTIKIRSGTTPNLTVVFEVEDMYNR